MIKMVTVLINAIWICVRRFAAKNAIPLIHCDSAAVLFI